MVFRVFVTALFILASTAGAQPAPLAETDPIRCWWKTSEAAVATGQPFTLTLTCAVLDTDRVRVVPDEGPLAVEAIQLAPFELLGGDHPADLRSGPRRFLQYEYRLRIVDPTVIGKDVGLPATVIHYRVESRAETQSSEGRDKTYLLPRLSIRVLSLVSADASDIRDAGDASFGAIDALRFRARVGSIVAIALAAIGALVLAPAVIRALMGARPTKRGATKVVSDRAVLAGVTTELKDVRDQARGGWTPELAARAAACFRVAAAYALGRRVAQRPLTSGPQPDAGRLTIGNGYLRRRRAAVTSPVTSEDLSRELQRSDGLPVASAEVGTLETLHTALAALTRAQYAAAPDHSTLDEAVAAGAAAVENVRAAHGPLARLRRSRR